MEACSTVRQVTRWVFSLSLFLAAIWVSLIQTASAQTASGAAAVLAQAKAASGGDAWDGVYSLHIQSTTMAGGVAGVQDEWDDVRTGRYAVHSLRPPDTVADGFDGVSVWTTARGGYSYVLGDEDARQGAINQAYQTCRAFWFPDRANATLTLGAPQQDADHVYDVVDVTPQAGRPFSIWIDRATHLIDRYVEQQGEDVQITRLLDYRTVDGLKLPFTVRVGDGDTQWDEVDAVQSVTVDALLAPTQFSLPPEPAPDFQFLHGKTSTAIPFRVENDKLLVPIKIDGQGPFDAELDTGGNYIVQPALAKRLGMKSTGAAQEGGGGEGYVTAGKVIADTVDLGDIRLTKQSYKILSFSDAAPERTLVGLQILQRFVVSIDFDTQTLTLTRPDRLVYDGSGTIVPFHFQDNQPEVNGAVDGIAGVFTIDTGDDGSLLLIAPFVRRYDLVRKYGATIPYRGGAVGGATHGLMTRAGTLALFGADGRTAIDVHDPLTRLSQQKGGFDADRYVSGNIGLGILKQFNLVFDYSRQRIIFEKNRGCGAKDVYNRTGLQLKRDGLAWNVIDIVSAGPAAQAGIKTGDTLSSINGRDAAHLTADDLYALFRQRVGTKITLGIRSGSSSRAVVLALRDVL